MLNFFFFFFFFFFDGMGFSLCNYFFSLINLLVVWEILYILNYNASPQGIFFLEKKKRKKKDSNSC